MSTLNDYGDDRYTDDSIGDIAYDTLEDSAKKEAKNLAEKTVKSATDRIGPVKRLKDALKKLKQKIRNAARKLARDGLHAVGRLAVNGVKAVGRFIAAHPVAALIIFVILLFVMSAMDDVETDMNNGANDGMLLDSPVYVDRDNISDDEVVTILLDDCVKQQYDSMGELNAEKEVAAKQIYSVFRSSGFNNASIAGMLGNMDIESGLDPSAIEGIFSEYGFLGSRKAAALLSLTNYTENTLFPSYAASGTSINRDGYKVVNDSGQTVYYCGIGLAQWTGANAYTFLRTAETLNMDWYDMDFQLGYLISDCIYRPGFFAGWLTSQYEGDDDASWVQAARDSGIKYAHEFEGNTGNDSERADAAESWYNIIKDWGDGEVDQGYVDTITGLATELGGLTMFLDVELAQYRCLNGNVFDNSSLANAAVSFAWPTRAQSYNNGTNLYQIVHDGIYPTDYIYKACDRCVAMAVLWSGTDDSYPLGTSQQLPYLLASAKWEQVGMSNSLSLNDLQPGDVFILNGHTFIYVGEGAVSAAYAGEAESGSDSVSASLNTRSAACDRSAGNMITNNGGMDWEGRGAYYVFRCVDPDNSDTYKSIGSGAHN